jgi:hypothetical protein
MKLQAKKAIPLHATKALGGERRYISYSFSTSALDGGEWSASRPGRALAPAKGPPVPRREAGWAQEPVLDTEVRGKIICLCRGSNLDLPVVQPVARHYTDWATGSLKLQTYMQFYRQSTSYMWLKYISIYFNPLKQNGNYMYQPF